MLIVGKLSAGTDVNGVVTEGILSDSQTKVVIIAGGWYQEVFQH